MSLGPSKEELTHFQRRVRVASHDRARQWVLIHHRGARAEGSTVWWSFWVGDRVVGYAWPVRNHQTDWWVAIKPMTTTARW